MPRLNHEAQVRLIRNAPSLLARLVCPDDPSAIRSVRLTSSEFADLNIAEYRADAVVLLGDEPRRPIRVLIRCRRASIRTSCGRGRTTPPGRGCAIAAR